MTATAHGHAGLVGPNAITQLGAAVARHHGAEAARALFGAAGLAAHFAESPQAMVPETEVRALHSCLWQRMGDEEAARLSWEAGLRTGDYLLAHRIPHPAQRLLRWLPPRLAAMALIAGIRRHAWTFAGSGSFSARVGRGCTVSIAGCPICTRGAGGGPVCVFYTAVFQGIFRALVHHRAQVRETACEAEGAPACTFEITW
ncbi:bacteriochlorophyll 4-vinyl reductase [Limibaculum sp. FT325]|uniref:bacteriochlorophyll 4-vinyl reductase n=1 Tax=Thermohalobaculum sediminis TaxID=2939436 RepID=UPI0020BFC937|nr:bacteriochlorophyll 4-vinyl reductase [Limibaculum sediminis]MCL5778596.1 bacteriochlorophyll 4-vinyl reductase [Limibaculum sediminis]